MLYLLLQLLLAIVNVTAVIILKVIVTAAVINTVTDVTLLQLLLAIVNVTNVIILIKVIVTAVILVIVTDVSYRYRCYRYCYKGYSYCYSYC